MSENSEEIFRTGRTMLSPFKATVVASLLVAAMLAPLFMVSVPIYYTVGLGFAACMWYGLFTIAERELVIHYNLLQAAKYDALEELLDVIKAEVNGTSDEEAGLTVPEENTDDNKL